MPWWGWITIGAICLIAEMTIVDLQFFLVFLGASALLVGLLGLAGFALPFWGQWLAFAVLAVGSLVVFRRRLYSILRPPPEDQIREGVVGDRATSVGAIGPGKTGTVVLRGSTWTGRNVGADAIPPGGPCRIERADGVVLEIHLEP